MLWRRDRCFRCQQAGSVLYRPSLCSLGSGSHGMCKRSALRSELVVNSKAKASDCTLVPTCPDKTKTKWLLCPHKGQDLKDMSSMSAARTVPAMLRLVVRSSSFKYAWGRISVYRVFLKLRGRAEFLEAHSDPVQGSRFGPSESIRCVQVGTFGTPSSAGICPGA